MRIIPTSHAAAWRRLFMALLLLVPVANAGCGGGSGDEVWIIGLDGADWDMLDPMIEAGDLPNLAQLRDGGAYGRLRSDEPMLSPVLWTSIATGKTADEHGVTWFMTDAPDGQKIPISSRNRWVRAVWNIAHERGLSSGIIGWWATWPVEPIDGFLVSDYVGWHSFGVTGQQIDAPGKVWPADIQREMIGMIPPPEEVDDALLQTMVHLPSSELGFDASKGPFGGPVMHLRQAAATARGYTDIALEMLDRERPRLFAVYYEGTDAAMHLFGNYAPPQQDWVSDEDYAAFKDAVSGYWKYQDRLLGELLARRGDRTTIVVVSDHGFRTGDERLREEQFDVDLADASHMIDGVVVVNGPGIQPGTRLRGASIYDVTPTVLHLLGLPVATDMVGKVLEDAFTPEYRATAPVQTIATYETGPWDRGDDVVVDAEAGQRMEEMLRSLGYISGGGDEPGAPGDGTGGGDMTIERAVNLANVLKGQGRYAEAAATLEEQLKSHPGHFEGRLNLAQIYGEMGDVDRAIALYEELARDEPGNLAVIEDHALALALAGRWEDAARIYDEGLELDEDWAMGLAGRGHARFRMGRTDEGLADVQSAIDLDPRLATAHYYLGLIQQDRGDLRSATEAFERTLALDPTHERAALQLSRLMQARGRSPEARRFLVDFLEKAGDSPTVRLEIATIDLKSGRPDEALPALRAAHEAEPDNPDVLGNLGIALAMTGDGNGAQAMFERLVEIQPNSAEAHAQLGNFYMQARQIAKAEQELKRAVELEPENTQFQLALATLYHGSGRLPPAVEIYEAVIRREPDNAIAIYQLAMAVGAGGDEARAMELLERARELDPSLPMPGQQR